MFYLIIAILLSSTLSILMRISEKYVKGNISMLAVNYLSCTAVGLMYTGVDKVFMSAEGFGLSLGLGLIGGALYLGGFLLLQFNIKQNGVVLPATFMKLGLLVPIIVSITIFGERPNTLQIVGFAVALVAILLINFDKEAVSKNFKPVWLVVLLLIAGFGDTTTKVFDELGNPALSDQFLLFLFGAACVVALILTAVKKQKMGKWEIIFGILLGVPNYLSSRFMLMALDYLPAVIVYPTFSVGGIVVVTLAGVLFFHEKLSKKQLCALALISAALTMLNI